MASSASSAPTYSRCPPPLVHRPRPLLCTAPLVPAPLCMPTPRLLHAYSTPAPRLLHACSVHEPCMRRPALLCSGDGAEEARAGQELGPHHLPDHRGPRGDERPFSSTAVYTASPLPLPHCLTPSHPCLSHGLLQQPHPCVSRGLQHAEKLEVLVTDQDKQKPVNTCLQPPFCCTPPSSW